MRDIKFRGKRPDNGEWIIGWLFQDDDDHLPMIHQGGTLDVWEQVSENTVGQFTGMTDCKGFDIYEGDILATKCGDNIIDYAEVFWGDDQSAFLVEYYNEEKQTTGNVGFLSEYDAARSYICGNVHDNPDWLNNEN